VGFPFDVVTNFFLGILIPREVAVQLGLGYIETLVGATVLMQT